MSVIDGFIWASIGAIAGFFLGMIAAVALIVYGRADDGETS